MYRKNASQTVGFGMTVISTGADDTSGNYGFNRSRDNDTLSSCTGNLVNKGSGAFVFVFSSDDLNGNACSVWITGPSLATVRFTFRTTQANPDDATRFGLAALPNAAAGAANGLWILGSNAGAVTLASLSLGSSFVIGNSLSILNQQIVAGGIIANLIGSVNSIAVGGIGASSFTTAALNAMADALLDRNMATGTDSGTNATRTVRQALRTSRNKVDTVSGIVFKEDDSTTCYTFSVTTAAGNPITVFDPADV